MTLPASDNFNRANGNLDVVPGNWSKTSDLQDPQISSNAVVKNAAGDSCGYWKTDSFNANHYSELKITTANDGGPAVRCSASGCYYFSGTSGTNTCSVWRYKTSGNWVQIGSSFSLTFSGTDVIRLAATGSSPTTLKVYLNGTLKATLTDSSSPLTTEIGHNLWLLGSL